MVRDVPGNGLQEIITGWAIDHKTIANKPPVKNNFLNTVVNDWAY